MTAPSRFFVFIRAINVGRRRLTNDQLTQPFVKLGFDNVAAYQAAGNITFLTSNPNAAHPQRLETALTEAYGFNPVVFVRNIDEMASIVSARPFTDAALAKTAGRVQVCLLRDNPDERLIPDVIALVPPEDRIEFLGCELYWLPTSGVSDSQLPIRSNEAILGPMTIRTLGTISRMLDKFAG